jgi:hypothetical protein
MGLSVREILRQPSSDASCTFGFSRDVSKEIRLRATEDRGDQRQQIIAGLTGKSLIHTHPAAALINLSIQRLGALQAED